jgi:hypothetical protein
VATAAVVLAAGARAAEAQIGVKASGGLSFPMNETSDALDIGWHAGAGPFLVIPGLPSLVINTVGGIHRFPGEQVGGGAEGPGLRILDAQLNLTWRLGAAAPLGLGLRPFVTAGGGVFNLKPVGDAAPENAESETELGVNGGVGFEFRLGPASLVVEGRYTNVFTDGDDVTYVPVSVGIMFGG